MTHYCSLTQELNPKARAWYEKETASQEWRTRNLQRNVRSQYYYRVGPKYGRVQSEGVVEMPTLIYIFDVVSQNETEFD